MSAYFESDLRLLFAVALHCSKSSVKAVLELFGSISGVSGFMMMQTQIAMTQIQKNRKC